MARVKNSNQKKKNNGANVGYEAELWQMADALRGSMDAAEYKHVVLGLIFLKYISDAFEEQHAKLEAERTQGADPEDPDEYRALNIFWVPPEARWSHLKAQAKQPTIAQLLGTLDDKIELNRRMNETLEAMARAIFKSWFVDFDPVRAKAEGRDPDLPKPIVDLFPDRFEDSELGEIPVGWSVRALYECAEYMNGSAFRNDHFSLDRLGLPVIKIGELKDSITDQTKFTEAILKAKYRITSGDILFSWSGSPDTSIDTFVWVGRDGWLNQHIFKITFKRPEEKYFAYYLLRHLKPEFVKIARNKQTTGLGHVTAQDLKRLKTVFPPDAIIREFNRMTEPLFQKTYGNDCESAALASLRDTLLPKLISGELRVKDAERIVEIV